MKNLEKIAKLHNLEVIHTTERANGYPENIMPALIGLKSFEQAEELAELHGLSIESFHKRNGWGFWERRGTACEAFTNSCEDYGDAYTEITKMDFSEFLDEEVRPVMDMNLEDFDELQANLNNLKEIWEEVEKLEEGQIVILHEGWYYETINRTSMYFYDDTHHYVIGLVNLDDE